MTKLEALKAAKAHVDEMAEEKNDRGYPRYTMSADQRIEHELRIAIFLMDEE